MALNTDKLKVRNLSQTTFTSGSVSITPDSYHTLCDFTTKTGVENCKVLLADPNFYTAVNGSELQFYDDTTPLNPSEGFSLVTELKNNIEKYENLADYVNICLTIT